MSNKEEKFENISDFVALEDNEEIKEIEQKLYAIRKETDFKLADIKEKVNGIKRNKLIANDEKQKLIAEYNESEKQTKQLKIEKKEEVKKLVKKGNELVIATNKVAYPASKKVETEKRKLIRAQYKTDLANLSASFKEKMNALDKTNENYKTELNNIKNEFKSAKFDLKKEFSDSITKSKYETYSKELDAYNKMYSFGNGKTPLLQNVQHKARTYVFNFNIKDFLIKNGLYIIILLFFIASFIAAPLMGKGNLLTGSHISLILEQSSTKIFYALGVAGLILLAGTDLSIGRMVGMASVLTGIFLHKGPNIIKLFGFSTGDFTAWPIFARILVALLVSIIATTLFSMIAGFFTSKFKMHPFITTLSTQLMIYGIFYYGTDGLPVGQMDRTIKNLVAGRFLIGKFPIYKISIYAIIAIVIVWFIWNKTKFGKNMYAVGGNQEAAAVSGISVFWTTMGVFIMAGILYGCGSFLEAFRTNPSIGAATGFELDAIAACVVGGISFSGGVGKISGAVVGVIIFTGLTYVLTVLGIDVNLQFLMKGIIIMAAVALDSLKYLKKK